MQTRSGIPNGGVHAWQFPLPIRASRFVPLSPRWKDWNIEADAAAIQSYEFTKRTTRDLLWFDYHTALDGNYHGRLGSGRGGTYRGYYVKGLGRTPAAANWNDVEDRYHSTGHMAPGQALREFLISRELQSRGLGHLIVPCETLLLQPLTPERSLQIARLQTRRTRDYRPPADQSWMALSLKAANFGRHANFVWAFHHLSENVPDLGALFLDFQNLLTTPADRREPDGDPSSIVSAMEAAIFRGFDHFLQFTTIGLFWLYMQNNVTLDGRFLDLETPLYLDRPFIGKFTLTAPGKSYEQLLGFECFHWIRLWRTFLPWLGHQLEMYLQPGYFDHPSGAAFVKDLRRTIRRRFHAASFLYDDEAIRSRAVAAFLPLFGARRELKQIARLASDQYWKGSTAMLPVWDSVPRGWASPTPSPIKLRAPAFAVSPLGSRAQDYAADLDRAGNARDWNSLQLALKS